MRLQRKEKHIENDILIWLNAQPGCFAFKVQTAGWYDQRLGRIRKNLSKFIIPGTSDILCCYQGMFISMEVKSEKGVQSDHQIHFEKLVKTKGKGPYFVVRSIEDADAALFCVRENLHK